MKSPLSQFVNRAVDNEGNILTHTIATITNMRMPTQPFSPPPNPNNPRGEIHEKPISNLENSKFAADTTNLEFSRLLCHMWARGLSGNTSCSQST